MYTLQKHFEGVGSESARKYHRIAVEKAETFKPVMENKLTLVDQQLSKARSFTHCSSVIGLE